MIEAVLLGTGVPTIGKVYPAEYLANPKNHRLRCALLLRSPQGNILVDAGADVRQQLLRENVLSLDCVLITHTHADHIMGMDDLRAYCIKTENPIEVFTLPRYQEDIRKVFSYAFGEFPEGIWVPRFELHDAPSILERAGMKVQIAWVDHGPWPVMAIRVNDFAYVTDVNHIPPDAREMLQDLNVLVLDAVRYRPHPNHYHYEKAIEVAQELGAKKPYFTHLADDYDHDKTNAELPPGIELAYDGLTLQI